LRPKSYIINYAIKSNAWSEHTPLPMLVWIAISTEINLPLTSTACSSSSQYPTCLRSSLITILNHKDNDLKSVSRIWTSLIYTWSYFSPLFQLPQKMTLDSMVVKIDSKIIILLCLSQSETYSVKQGFLLTVDRCIQLVMLWEIKKQPLQIFSHFDSILFKNYWFLKLKKLNQYFYSILVL